MVRAGIALALTLLLLPIVLPLIKNSGDQGLMGASVITELLVGAMLGLLARLPSLALTMSGSLISYMTGLSNVVQNDPSFGGQSVALARLFGLIAPVLILSSGLYALPISALAGSYEVIPAGSLLPSGPLVETMTGAVAASFGLSLGLAAPFLLTAIILQSALGLLAKLVPQLQLYTVAPAGQILGGLALLGLAATTLLATWSSAVREAWSNLPGL